ncbi:hypothetical protein PV703_23075 [Streptomyces sp. ME01-24h]|nr:hypothetical protein [Streptomyces sp. ME01-24h]
MSIAENSPSPREISPPGGRVAPARGRKALGAAARPSESAGWNTVDFVTGTFPTSCGDIRDDFAVSDITLIRANGTASGRMLKGSYSFGDGNCGDNVNPLTEVDLEFFVDGPAQGLHADLETEKIADGKHTLAATSKTGRTATRVLVTDNSAPSVASSVPVAGQRLTASAVLDIRLDDLSGVVKRPNVMTPERSSSPRCGGPRSVRRPAHPEGHRHRRPRQHRHPLGEVHLRRHPGRPRRPHPEVRHDRRGRQRERLLARRAGGQWWP